MHLSITDISDKDVSNLAAVLQRLPGEASERYAKRISSLIRKLPSHLKRRGLLSHLAVKDRSSPEPFLCTLHKGFNAGLIHDIFVLVCLEVGLRLNTLVVDAHRLTSEQWSLVSTLRSLHAMWLAPVVYERTFHSKPPVFEKSRSKMGDMDMTFQRDGCEACVLARIGRHVHMIANLRTVLRSRTRSSPDASKPKLLRFVDAWLKHRINNGYDATYEDVATLTDAAAASLRILRQQIHQDRKSERRRRKHGRQSLSTTLTSTTDQDIVTHKKGYDSGAELAIIDHYLALTSTPYLPCFPPEPSPNVTAVDPEYRAAYASLNTDFHKFEISADVHNGWQMTGSSEALRKPHPTSSVYPDSVCPASESASDEKRFIGTSHRKHFPDIYETPILPPKDPARQYQNLLDDRVTNEKVKGNGLGAQVIRRKPLPSIEGSNTTTGGVYTFDPLPSQSSIVPQPLKSGRPSNENKDEEINQRTDSDELTDCSIHEWTSSSSGSEPSRTVKRPIEAVSGPDASISQAFITRQDLNEAVKKGKRTDTVYTTWSDVCGQAR